MRFLGVNELLLLQFSQYECIPLLVFSRAELEQILDSLHRQKLIQGLFGKSDGLHLDDFVGIGFDFFQAFVLNP